MSWTQIMISLIQNSFFKKARVTIFADIIKILTIFIEKIYKGLKKS